MRVISGSLLNTAVATVSAVVLALLLAQFKGWSAATRFALWWVTLAFVILAPIVSALLPVRYVPSEKLPPTVASYVSHSQAAETAIQVKSGAKPFPITLVVFSICALASMLQTIRLFRGFLFGIRLKRNAKRVPESLRSRFTRLVVECHIRRPVVVRSCDLLQSPAMIGYFTPQVLAPTDLESKLSHDELEQILLHELAHVARYDDWTIAIQRLIEAVFTWHPLVRFLGYKLNRDRESACDDFVAVEFEPKRYAACLAKMAGLGSSPSPAVLVGLLERKSDLLSRIEILLDKTRTHVPAVSVLRVCFTVVALAVLGITGIKAPRLMALPMPPQVTGRVNGVHAITINSPVGASVMFVDDGDSVKLGNHELNHEVSRLKEKQIALEKSLQMEVGQPWDISAQTLDVSAEEKLQRQLDTLQRRIQAIRSDFKDYGADGRMAQLSKLSAELFSIQKDLVIYHGKAGEQQSKAGKIMAEEIQNHAELTKLEARQAAQEKK